MGNQWGPFWDWVPVHPLESFCLHTGRGSRHFQMYLPADPPLSFLPRKETGFFFFFLALRRCSLSSDVKQCLFKMHESTLIWNEFFTLWFLNILLLLCLPSWSDWKVHSWMWQRSTKIKASCFISEFCALFYQREVKSFRKHRFPLPFTGHFK